MKTDTDICAKLTATATEDRGYKPASPDAPKKRFLVETDEYRWEVLVWRYSISETGTPLYRAVTSEGHSAYGFTVNEAVNCVKGIMQDRLRALSGCEKSLSLDDVRSYIDPVDAAREDLRIARERSRKPLLSRLFGL